MIERGILVAGIGNVFLGDDAFGVEVIRQLASRELPDGVRVVDFGIRAFDLAYALLDDHELVILVDALPRDGNPGTLYVLEPDLDALDAAAAMAVDAHTIDPVQVLCLVKAMEGHPRRVLVVGCEPASVEPDDEGRMGLSEPVQAVVEEAAALVASLIADALAAEPSLAQLERGPAIPRR
jgi:hydrogenase maturation protease